MLNEDRDALVARTPDGSGLIQILGLGGIGASSNFGSEETIKVFTFVQGPGRQDPDVRPAIVQAFGEHSVDSSRRGFLYGNGTKKYNQLLFHEGQRSGVAGIDGDSTPRLRKVPLVLSAMG